MRRGLDLDDQIITCRVAATSEIFFPGRINRMAASNAVRVAAMRSAARPVIGASPSWMTMVWATVEIKPSMCTPRSLQNARAHIVIVKGELPSWIIHPPPLGLLPSF